VSFINEHRDRFGVEPICETLQVAPSTYYAALARPPSARQLRGGKTWRTTIPTPRLPHGRPTWSTATSARRRPTELRLMIYPVVLGAGERLFGDSNEKKPMRLVSTRTVDDLALLIYEVVRLRS